MKHLTTVIKYLISLSISLGLLYYVFKDIDFSELSSRATDLRYSWLLLSMALAIVSHIARAYRWNLMLKPLGHKNLSVFRTFLAVMVGYFGNLIIPRAGEVIRCGMLKRSDQVPVSTGVGSVVAERLLDLIMLLASVVLVIFLEFDKLYGFIIGLFSNKYDQHSAIVPILLILIGGFFTMVFLGIYLWKKQRTWLRKNALFLRVEAFIEQLSAGLMSIQSLENKTGFFLSTIVIWVMYFTMSYVIFFSTPITEHLTLRIGLAMFVMGGLGMAAPVQGGIGAYHWIVSQTLALYGMNLTDGVFFATVMHTTQTLMILIVGGLSLAVSLIMFQKKGEASSGESIISTS